MILKINNGNGPDLLGVCEVENRYVLELLLSALEPLSRTYAIVHYEMSDQRGIDVAFIYDSKLFKATDNFSHYIIKRTATRDLFQVNFRTTKDRLLIVIGNHWPARSAGQYKSEPCRIIAGETLAYFHQSIQEEHGKDASVLVMGDFNDETHDQSLAEYALCERTRIKVM